LTCRNFFLKKPFIQFSKYSDYHLSAEFIKKSRQKAQEAQKREQKTIQPKEVLSTQTKATITISNYLGGLYYLTTDEIKIQKDKLFLIEGKYTKNSVLPSLSDIKDGLLKMILYINLKNVKINDQEYITIPVLKLSSSRIKGNISSKDSQNDLLYFMNQNKLNNKHKEIINNLWKESEKNNFLIEIESI